MPADCSAAVPWQSQSQLLQPLDRSRGSGQHRAIAEWVKEPALCYIKPTLRIEYVVQSEECRSLFDFDESNILERLMGSDNFVRDWLQSLYTVKVRPYAAQQCVSTFGDMELVGCDGVLYKALLSASYWTVPGPGPEDIIIAGLQLKFSPPRAQPDQKKEETAEASSGTSSSEEAGGSSCKRQSL